jgi:hypothetical protein
VSSTPAFEAILREATEAAVAATNRHLSDHPGQWYPCGFAWVTIKPARGKFISFLKDRKVGRKSESSGWTIWNPSQHMTQWLDAKLVGAEAFADVLRKHGINAQADSRWD